MTSYSEEMDVTRKCYICGEITTFAERYLLSYHRWGDVSPYMDTCSYEDQVSKYEVCPKCGYIAHDISQKTGGKGKLKYLIESPAYRETAPYFTEKPSVAYRRYLIEMELGNYDEALGELIKCYIDSDGESYHWKRWGEDAHEGWGLFANHLRYMIISLLKRKYNEATSPSEKNSHMLQIMDLYRRSGCFEEVKQLSGRGIIHELVSRDELKTIIDELAKLRDSGQQLTQELARKLIDDKEGEDFQTKKEEKYDWLKESIILHWATEQLGYEAYMSEETLNTIIDFELRKAEEKDTGKYTFAYALNPEEGIIDVERMGWLSEREQRVLIMRYGLDGKEPMSVETVAKELNVTRERLRQIEAKAMRKARRGSSGIGHATAVYPISEQKEYTGEKCEKCGKPMLRRHGRFGAFIVCEGYPECDNIRPQVKEIGVKCPECGGELIERKGRSGKVFYGCSNYPKCTQVFWNKPVNKKCPKCGALLVEKGTEDGKDSCSNKGCTYSE